MTQAADTSKDASPRTGASALVEAMRPLHWVKNAFVAAPLLFSERFTDALSWLLCAAAVGAFCLAGSAIYLINDIRDRDRDRLHPSKRGRPIASGRLSAGAAGAAAIVLLGAAGVMVALTEALTPRPSRILAGHALATWTGAYVALNLLYTFWLKHVFIVDVLVVAFGFVLRAMAGAAALAVPVSPWLVVCTLTLCLFIALTKRRGELADLPAEQAAAARPVNRAYDEGQLRHMITVSTAMAILTYTLYCLSPQTVGRLGSAHMVWTVPLVIYGLFRFDRLTRRAGGGDPVAVLVRDPVMWLILAAYVLLTTAVLRFGDHPAVRDILVFPK